MYTFSEPNKRFSEKHINAYGDEPGIHADVAYDAVYLVKEAFEKAGNAATSEELVAALESIETFEGASGQIDLTVNHYPLNKESVLRIFKNGQLVASEI